MQCRCVFVTVKPEYDTPKKLQQFGDLFDPMAKLILLREDSNQSKNLVSMLRKFKVPVGLTPEEVEKLNEYFASGQIDKRKWYQKLYKKKDQGVDIYTDHEHSRVIYLMDPDNSFLQMFPLDMG